MHSAPIAKGDTDMTRLVFIDNHSGYIWGDLADMPLIDAARQLDESIGGDKRAYSLLSLSPRDDRTGYHVYRVDTEMPHSYDGQDQEIIDLVTNDGIYAGFVEAIDAQ